MLFSVDGPGFNLKDTETNKKYKDLNIKLHIHVVCLIKLQFDKHGIIIRARVQMFVKL